MKEATGELNMTVVTLVAVAAVAALFYFFLWPMIQKWLLIKHVVHMVMVGQLNMLKKFQEQQELMLRLMSICVVQKIQVAML